MFGIGFGEMVVIFIIALVVIGPRQLPEVARLVGRMLNELRRATSDLTDGLHHKIEEDLTKMRSPRIRDEKKSDEQK